MSETGYRPGSIADMLGSGKRDESSPKSKEMNNLFAKPSKSILKAQKLYQKQKRRSEKKQKLRDEPGSDNGSLQNKKKTKNPSSTDIVEKQGRKFPDRKQMRAKAKQLKALNEEKSKTTVFVGNLSTSIDKKTVAKMFKKYGSLQSIRFRSAAPSNPKMPKKGVVAKKDFHEKMSIINAYVVFDEAEAAKNAEELNGEEVDGHHIRVEFLGKDTTKHKHSHSVFVGNLPFDIDDDTVHEHFKQCGEVESVRVVRDKFTRVGKGFGYVLFKEKDSVLLALKLDQGKLNKRKLRVQRSSANAPKAPQSTPGKANIKSTVKQHAVKRKRDASSDGKSGLSEKPMKKVKKDKQVDSFSGSKSKTTSKLSQKKKLKKRLERKKKVNIANVLLGKKAIKDKATKSGEKISANKRMKKPKQQNDRQKKGRSKQRFSSQ